MELAMEIILKAALMTRGMTEIVRVGVRLGGNAETFYGLLVWEI